MRSLCFSAIFFIPHSSRPIPHTPFPTPHSSHSVFYTPLSTLHSSGQLEARERLLSEMEMKARERVEAAEVEAYRLKGAVQFSPLWICLYPLSFSSPPIPLSYPQFLPLPLSLHYYPSFFPPIFFPNPILNLHSFPFPSTSISFSFTFPQWDRPFHGYYDCSSM